MKIFSHELKTTTTKINGLWAYLGTGDIDFDDLQITGNVEFTLTPDECCYGWDGIKSEVVDVNATVIWKVYIDEDTLQSDKDALYNAGGKYDNGGFIEGNLLLQMTDKWKMYEDVEIQNNGAMYLQQVEFDLCQDKSKIILSIR